MIAWHPMIVHFPLALSVSAAGLLGASRCVKNERRAAVLATAGSVNLILGAVAALCALGSGLAAVLDLNVGPAAQRSVSLHAIWAVFTSLALIMLAVWRGAGNAPDSRPSWLLIVVLAAATAALIVTGYRGGQNVYRYGIGVAPAARTGSLSHRPAESFVVSARACPGSIGRPSYYEKVFIPRSANDASKSA